jgi:hypothetical protein
MGKKPDSIVSSVEFTPDVYAIIQETMVKRDYLLGAAVRFLIKKGKEQIEWEDTILADARMHRSSTGVFPSDSKPDPLKDKIGLKVSEPFLAVEHGGADTGSVKNGKA